MAALRFVAYLDRYAAEPAYPPNSLEPAEWFDAVLDETAELLDLAENWDGHGGMPVSPQAIEWILEFLLADVGPGIERPSLYATPGGGVGAEWSTRDDHEIVVEIDRTGLTVDAAILTDEDEDEFELVDDLGLNRLLEALRDSYPA